VQFLVSAGEASGDLYASGVVSHLRTHFPSSTFYGCAGPRLKQLQVDPVVDSSELAVVGLAEVLVHLPRIYGQYRKLIRYAKEHKPDAALLTDSPDFHLRLARHLKRLHVPVFYLVAPQVWAWRQGRVRTIARLVDRLFCLFPFEERWFRDRGVDATYIGHPLANLVRRTETRSEFLARYALPEDRQVLVLLPGSRVGEVERHIPVLLNTVNQLRQHFPISVLLATAPGFPTHTAFSTFRERFRESSIKVIENDTWNCIGHADLALAASGTVTVEAAVLGTPMVTFYKVNPLSWYAGRHLVKVPFLSMVNLIAERQIVPELIQNDMTSEKLAAEAADILQNPGRADRMRQHLAGVQKLLTGKADPFRLASDIIAETCTSRSDMPAHAHEVTVRQ
jgi:lipid-A-disaccharide synthase